MPKRANLYTGRAGQMAVMAEFLLRGYNVAIPEVDVGDDIFVVTDSSGEYARVQVKTALALPTKTGYSARYLVKLSQLERASTPETWYIFANRLHKRWISFVVVSRQTLYTLYDLYQIGALSSTGLFSLYVSYTENNAICSGQDLSTYLDNWQQWPPVIH
jgi:hypothetical protein